MSLIKKCCIISYINFNNLPYANIYINKLLENGVAIDFVYWDREDNERKHIEGLCSFFPYSKLATFDVPRFKRYLHYFGATKHIRKALENNNYDCILFLSTHASVACADILNRKYKGKYMIDVRDYCLENHRVFYEIEKRVMHDAFAVVISSPAYTKFLPPSNFIQAHNYSPFTDCEKETIITRNHMRKPINISYVGNVRYYNMDKQILLTFANNSNFQINYFGLASDPLKVFCKQKNIFNTAFKGRFNQSDTIKMYERTDLINNLYGNHSPYLDYALSNKLYHAAQLQIPILVCPETYMEEIVHKYNMGFVFDVNKRGSVSSLLNEYENFNWDLFQKGCTEFLMDVKSDMHKFSFMLDKFFAL